MDLLLSLLTPFHSSGPVLLLSSLFNRTFSLLSASAQSELLSSTCISHRSWLWAHIKGSFLHVDNLTGVAPCLATDSISQLSQHSTLHTYEALVSEGNSKCCELANIFRVPVCIVCVECMNGVAVHPHWVSTMLRSHLFVSNYCPFLFHTVMSYVSV